MKRGARRSRGASAAGSGLAAGILVTALGLGAVTVVGGWNTVWQRFRPASPATTPYADVYRAAAEKFPSVPASLLAAQARAESNFDAGAVSPAGARGLLQIMPATFDRFAVDGDADGRRDPFDPTDSVFTAAAYLSYLGSRFGTGTGDPQVLAAYNAGPAAVDAARGVPVNGETRTYVARVRQWAPRYRWLDS